MSGYRVRYSHAIPRTYHNETFVDDDGEAAWSPRARRSIARSCWDENEELVDGGPLDVLAPIIAHHVQQQRACRSTPTKRPRPAVLHYSPAKLHTLSHLIERSTVLRHPTSSPSRPNTAVIAPVVRNIQHQQPQLSPATTPSKRDAISPLLCPSQEQIVKPSPTVHLPIEMLCCLGFFLLASGIASTLLSFYILSIVGKRYFLHFGAVCGFTSLTLGALSFRTNKWKWMPHRNYITGYMFVSVISVLHACCLGGIVYSLHISNNALVDTLGGAVCGLATLVIMGSIFGLVTSGCCHRPPPDNRVAHSVMGFKV